MPAPTSDVSPSHGSPEMPEQRSGTLRLAASGYASRASQELITEVQAEYTVRYGGPDDSPVDAAQFEPPSGDFLVAHVGDELVGMVALRRHGSDEDTAPGADLPSAELKRLYVRAGYRRRGYARTILALAEQRAVELGYRRLVLETGTAQPEAMALYAADGYHPIPGFGHYTGATLSRCFAKVLGGTPG